MVISFEDVLEMSGIETLHPGGFDLSRRIAELVNFNPSMRVLDVSSGKGAFACLYAKEFGCKVTGIDASQRFIDIATKRAEKEGVTDRGDFRIGDSRKLPFQNAQFDVVVNECAVGLTAIDAPQQVLKEMARVTRAGGRVVIHESIWLKELPENEKRQASIHIGTTPYFVEEWKRMLFEAGVVPRIVEDWSAMESLLKIKPNAKWDPDNPFDFLTAREKLTLFPRIILRYGIGSVLELYRFSKKLYGYLVDGYFGYVLIVASKEQ